MAMARDLSRALDPVLMAQDCGIVPDPWQAELLRSRPRRCLMLCARQTGKTEVAILDGLHQALYTQSALVVILSASQRQSAEVFRRLMLAHAKLDGVPELTAESALRAEFANSSRVIALPATEKTVRGIAGADLIIIDEAARVPDELISAVRPMMATKHAGRLVALSTPAGRRGWFHDAWTKGEDYWHRVRVAASECPRITPEFLAEELRELGAMKFSEEYELAWLEPDEAVFPTAIIAAAFTNDVVPLWR